MLTAKQAQEIALNHNAFIEKLTEAVLKKISDAANCGLLEINIDFDHLISREASIGEETFKQVRGKVIRSITSLGYDYCLNDDDNENFSWAHPAEEEEEDQRNG